MFVFARAKVFDHSNKCCCNFRFVTGIRPQLEPKDCPKTAHFAISFTMGADKYAQAAKRASR